MKTSELQKEIATIVLGVIIFAISASIFNLQIFYYALISFAIIVSANILTKKIISHHFEIEIKTKFWEFSRYGLKKSDHLKKPINMAWLPIVLSLLTNGMFLWLGILESDAKPKPERASRRHGLYRFTQVTEKHLGVIAFFGVLVNLALGIIGYIAGFELFTKLSFTYAVWSIIPIARLDGTRIFFGNRFLWAVLSIITFILFFLGLLI